MNKKFMARACVFAGTVAATLVIGVAPARADVFNFNYSLPAASGGGFPVTASGQFITDPESGGQFLITGISGTWNGVAITGLIAPFGFFNDNLLSPATPFISGDGVSFTVDGIGDDFSGNVNVFLTDCGGPCWTEDSGFVGSGTDFSVTPAASAPEPGSLLLAAAGLAGLAFWRFRRP